MVHEGALLNTDGAQVFVVAVKAPLLSMYAVAMYPVIGEPPLLFGAFHETVIDDDPAAALTVFGAPATV
jgi:hypothetical protein